MVLTNMFLKIFKISNPSFTCGSWECSITPCWSDEGYLNIHDLFSTTLHKIKVKVFIKGIGALSCTSTAYATHI